MTEPKNKVFYLDGIRGLAAFCVFLHHFLLAFYPAYFTSDITTTHLNGLDVRYGQSIFSFLSNGNFSVCIFFVLSGLVLSRSYFEQPNIATLVSAAQRRFLRLYMPVAVTLCLAYLLIKTNLFYNVAASSITHSGWWMGYMWTFEHKTTLFIQSLLYKVMFMGDNTYDTSLWTLSLELYGSMFVFAFLALTHNIRNKFLAFIPLFAVLAVLNAEYLTAFLLGITLNYAPAVTAKIGKTTNVLLTSVLFIGGLILGSYSTSNNIQHTIFEHVPAFVVKYNIWVHVIAGFFVVLAVVLSKNLQWFFSLGLMRFLGYISFSIYLLHPLVIGSFSCYLLLHLAPHFSYNLALLIVTGATLSVCFLLSYFMAKYVDANGTRYARKFYDNYLSKAGVDVKQQ